MLTNTLAYLATVKVERPHNIRLKMLVNNEHSSLSCHSKGSLTSKHKMKMLAANKHSSLLSPSTRSLTSKRKMKNATQ